MFRDVCFNTSKATSIDAEAEKKKITEITYYIGLQSTLRNGQTPVVFPDCTFCYHQQRHDLNQQIISIFFWDRIFPHIIEKKSTGTK